MGTVMENGGLQGYGGFTSQGETGAGTIASEGMDHAKQLGRTTWQRTLEQVEQRKGTVVEALDHFASALEGASKQQGDSGIQLPFEFAGRLAGYVRQFSQRIEQGTAEELLNDVEDQFRARPGLFMAGLLAAGFFAGRLFRR
jgi:hypothetical protein